MAGLPLDEPPRDTTVLAVGASEAAFDVQRRISGEAGAARQGA
jgi:hypothetical protein